VITGIFSPHLTTAVIGTGVWAGVDNAWEQGKLEARKILENAAESHTSGAPKKMGAIIFYERNRRSGLARRISLIKVYS